MTTKRAAASEQQHCPSSLDSNGMQGSHSMAHGHTGSIYGVAVTKSAPHLVASASDDETVRLWSQREAGNAWQQSDCVTLGEPAMCVTFSPDGTLLAAGLSDGIAHLYSVDTRDGTCGASSSLTACAQLRNHPEEVYGCEWLKCSSGRMCTVSGDSLFVWDYQKEVQLQKALPPAVAVDSKLEAMPEAWHPGYIFSMTQQPQGGTGSHHLAGVCSDGALRVWGSEGGHVTALWGMRLHDGPASSCAFSADGSLLISVSKSGHIVAMDMRQRQILEQAYSPVPLHACCLLPCGLLGVTGADGMLLSIPFNHLQGATSFDSEGYMAAAERSFSLACGGGGAPLVAGGEAMQIADDRDQQPALGLDPMFDAPELFNSGTGAQVLFTTADLDDNHNKPKQMAAALHFWN